MSYKTPVRYVPHFAGSYWEDADGMPIPGKEIERILNVHPKYEELAKIARSLTGADGSEPSMFDDDYRHLVHELAALKAGEEE